MKPHLSKGRCLGWDDAENIDKAADGTMASVCTAVDVISYTPADEPDAGRRVSTSRGDRYYTAIPGSNLPDGAYATMFALLHYQLDIQRAAPHSTG